MDGITWHPMEGDVFRVLAWGCGTPSTTVGVMSALGMIEPLDAIIHSDTKFECAHTVTARDWYADWFREHGIRVEIVTGGDIREDGATNHIHIPFWTSNGGPLRRECTRHFKVNPGKRRVRELLGFDPTKPPHPRPGSVEQSFGFTLDEFERLKPSRVKFIVNRFPLFEHKMTRMDCVRFLQAHDLPVPGKSACVCCPYRPASEWLKMREESPGEWREAVEFDERNRHYPLAGDGSASDQIFIYKHGGPLRDADLVGDAAREKVESGFALPLLCGDGPCWT
jgi:hypothetical protein